MADLPDPLLDEMYQAGYSCMRYDSAVWFEALRKAIPAMYSVATAGLRARLAQAEADREQLRDERAVLWPKAQVLSAVQANADYFQARAERAEATLARVAKLCEHPKRTDTAGPGFNLWNDGYNHALRAALVVADTGEGLSKTSAKPLVVADTPTAKAHQEGEADS